MKTYLFGVSRLLEKLSRGGYLREFRVEGLTMQEKNKERKNGGLQLNRLLSMTPI